MNPGFFAKRLLPLCLSLLVGQVCSAQGPQAFQNELMPQPMQLLPVEGTPLSLDASWSVKLSNHDAALSALAGKMIVRLQDETGIMFRSPWNADESKSASLMLNVEDTSTKLPFFGMDESYRLDVDAGGIKVSSHTLFGMERGVETLLQLVQHNSSGYFVPRIHIQDAPRFPWRGLLLDPGRHFLPVSVVLRTLDAMAAVKLNVLHLHLTENQGFRIESKRFPRLAAMGSGGEFYTQEQVRTIIAYAASLGIRVVPEFDLPGHSTSWFIGHPELASVAKNYETDRTFGVHDEAIDPTRESTYEFLDAFFGEMAELFPDSYMHIGGDESNGKQWESNPAIVAFMKEHKLADTHALQAYFNRRLQAILQKHGKKMVGWDEIIHPDLPADVIVQNWHSVSFLAQAARDGHMGFLSKPFYLDHNETAESMYKADPVSEEAHLTPAQAKLVVGGEACMWGEQVVPLTIDSRIWPRAAAMAERLWSPATVNDVDDMYRRLRKEELRLDALGTENLTGPERMLRQLSGERDPVELQTLADAVQPDDFHDRARLQKNTVDTPMTAFVDSVVFDPPLRHDLSTMMTVYLSADRPESARAAEQLRLLFQAWQKDGDELKRQCSLNPRLHEVQQRAQQLSALGEAGSTLLHVRSVGETLSPKKRTEFVELLKQAGLRDASMVEFVVLPPLQELLSATK